MTYRDDFTVPAEIMEQIAAEGLAYGTQMIALLINAAMKLEREQYLKAKFYERNEKRQGYANGFKSKSVQTRIGKLDLAIPQVREGGFYPEALEKGLRSERALLRTCAEMYVKGVSTRKVSQIIAGWDVSGVTNMQYMFNNVTLSTTNYDALLNGWDAQTLQNSVTFTGGNSNYCLGETARANMINSDNWTITDGGKECPVTPTPTPTQDPQALPDDFSSAQYTYDGDDNMVKSVIDGATTVLRAKTMFLL